MTDYSVFLEKQVERIGDLEKANCWKEIEIRRLKSELREKEKELEIICSDRIAILEAAVDCMMNPEYHSVCEGRNPDRCEAALGIADTLDGDFHEDRKRITSLLGISYP